MFTDPSWFHYFGAVFVFHICKHVHGFPSKLSLHIPLITPPPPPHLLGHWVHIHVLLLNHHERHFMFIHGTLLYLSLDGVIPEASIYVYSI